MIRNVSLSDPYMYYKLDPGEVGPTLPVKARESIMHVASHEAANLARMKYDAWSRGGIVVYEHLHLNYTRRGSFIAASSGYSEVKVIYPGKKGEAPPLYPNHYGIIDDENKDNSDIRLEDSKIDNKDLIKYIEDLKIDKDLKEAEQEIDIALNKAESESQDQRVKEAIKAYKAMIALVKGLKKSPSGKRLAESIISSVKNQVRNSIDVLT